MLFNSYTFLIGFLPATLLAFYLAGHLLGRQAAAVVALAASLLFYGWWQPLDLLIYGFSAATNFSLARLMSQTDRPTPRKAIFVGAIAFNLALLGYVKYVGLISSTLAALSGLDIAVEPHPLPPGISFYTFTQIALLVDVYRRLAGRVGVIEYFLFVSFFPHLIAGPIYHHGEIIPQMRRPGWAHFRPRRLAVGGSIFAIGLFKKVVIADHVGFYVDPIFATADAGGAIAFLDAWWGALAYTFQIYFDFSAYSDMAIGLGYMLGLRLPINFASPYKSLDIVDFWRRWHITLSRFLRDYLYVPLGGNRHGASRRYANLLIVMLLGGLWHGASWTFLAWGGLHGGYLIVCHAWKRMAPHLLADAVRRSAGYRVLAWTLTFLAVVVAWVFFRAANFDAAFHLLAAMAGSGSWFVATEAQAGLGPLAPLFADAGGGDPGVFALPYLVTWWQVAALADFYPRIAITGAVLLFVVTALPNTTEIVGHRAALGGLRPPAHWAWLRWRPTLPWAVVCAILLVTAVLQMRSNAIFLYFQF